MTERAFALAVLLVASCLVALAVLAVTERMTPVLIAALVDR